MLLADIEKGRSVPGDCGRPADQRPDWLDMDKFQRALVIYKNNFYSIMLAHSCGPVLMGSVSTLVLPVKFTGKSQTVPLACRRLANTVHHVLAWYEGNVWDPKDYAHESVQQIRRLHSQVAQKMSIATPLPKGQFWLSQFDMALTQFAFMGPMLLGANKIGMQCNREDMECLLHFWRGIGYLLGMEDTYNICAGGYEETYSLFQEIVKQVVFPTLSQPNEEFQLLVNNGIASLKIHSPLIETTSFIKFSYDLVDFPKKVVLSWYGLFCHWMRILFIHLLPISWIRNYANNMGTYMLHSSSKKYRVPSCPKQSTSSRFLNYVPNLFFGR